MSADWEHLASTVGKLPAPYIEGKRYRCDDCADRQGGGLGTGKLRNFHPNVITGDGPVQWERQKDEAGFSQSVSRPYQRCYQCWLKRGAGGGA